MDKSIVLFSLLLSACVPPTAPSGANESRGTWRPTDKADELATCESFCGGRSPGRCYCDRACEGWGDCCPDYQAVCSAPSDMSPGGTTGSGGTSGTTGWGTTGGYVPDGGWGYDLSNSTTGGTTGGTTGWGTTGGYVPDGGWGYDLSNSTTGGTTGWGGSDLSGPSPSYDLGPASSPDLSNPWYDGSFTADIPVERTTLHNGISQGVTSSLVPVTCQVKGDSQWVLVNCDGAGTWVAVGSLFTAYTSTGGTLKGRVILPNQLDLYSYDYLSADDTFGGQVSDHWSGLIIQWVFAS